MNQTLFDALHHHCEVCGYTLTSRNTKHSPFLCDICWEFYGMAEAIAEAGREENLAEQDTITAQSICIDDLAEGIAAAAVTRPYATRDALERALRELQDALTGEPDWRPCRLVDAVLAGLERQREQERASFEAEMTSGGVFASGDAVND